MKLTITTRIRRIFAYHYDQIQREVQTEISNLNPELQDILQNPEDLVSLSQHHKR